MILFVMDSEDTDDTPHRPRNRRVRRGPPDPRDPDDRKHMYEKKYFNLIFAGVNQEARTPQWLWNLVRDSVVGWQGRRVYDPCPPDPNFNGLERPWGQRNIVNPPYKDTGEWLKKGWQEYSTRGVESVFIIPFRPSRRYFHQYVSLASELYILSRRVIFRGYDRPFPGPICLVCFGCRLNLEKWVEARWRYHTTRALYKEFPRSYDYQDEMRAFIRDHIRGEQNYTTVFNSPVNALIDAVENGGPQLLFMLPFFHTNYFQSVVLKRRAIHGVVFLAPVLAIGGWDNRSLLGSALVCIGRTRIEDPGAHRVTFLW